MQMISHPKQIFQLYKLARSKQCLEAYKNLYTDCVNKYQLSHDSGADPKTCQALSGISRATYYRYKKILKDLEDGILPPSKTPKKLNKPKWGESEKQLVLKIRRENETYGKSKIATILKRDHNVNLSESTVGRILTHLKRKHLITKSRSALRFKRKRNFAKGYAKRAEFKKYEEMVLGERVQIDHMTVTKNGITVKHFQAWERKSKYIHACVYSHAKARSAKRFLLDFVAKSPFKILSIQVDGGSEFMAEFEDACSQLNIPLFVLPPRRPDYNGGVERGNRTFRDEFYSKNFLADSVRGIQAELNKSCDIYNSYRPHFSIDNLTPLQYIGINQS